MAGSIWSVQFERNCLCLLTPGTFQKCDRAVQQSFPGQVHISVSALFCGAGLAAPELRSQRDRGDTFLFVGFMIVLAMAMLRLPEAVERAVFGLSGQMACVSVACRIGATPGLWLMKKVGH